MKRRERYRNKEGGYWLAAADPDVAEHAKEKARWPRFKVSDDATIALIST